MHEDFKANQRAAKHAEFLFTQLSERFPRDLMETTSRHRGYLLQSFLCTCRGKLGFEKMIVLLGLHVWNYLPRLRDGFAVGDFEAGLNPQLLKPGSWISLDPYNSQSAVAIYTTWKCGFGTHIKKHPSCLMWSLHRAFATGSPVSKQLCSRSIPWRIFTRWRGGSLPSLTLL